MSYTNLLLPHNNAGYRKKLSINLFTKLVQGETSLSFVLPHDLYVLTRYNIPANAYDLANRQYHFIALT